MAEAAPATARPDDESTPPSSPDVAPMTEAPSRRKRRSRGPWVILGLLAAAGLVAAYYVTFLWGRETTDDAQIDADLVALPARVGGVVEEVRFEDNEHVDEGQVLVVLDDDLPRAALDRAEAELAAAQAAAEATEAEAQIAERAALTQKSAAKATLRGASASVSQYRGQVGVAQAAVDAAKAANAQAELEFERAKRLRDSGATTRAEYDRARTALDAAKANLAQAESNLGVTRRQIVTAGSRVAEANARYDQLSDVDAYILQARTRAEAARARVKVAQAAVDRARLDFDYAVIRAPRAGVLSKRTVAVGQNLAAGQAYATMLPDEDFWVTANFKETQIGHMSPGQPVRIEVDTYPDVELRGEIDSFAAATGSRFALLPPDNASGNYTKVVQRVPVRIRLLDTRELDLRPGMSVVVTVDVRDAS